MNKKQIKKRQLRARAHTTRPREPRLCIFCLSNKNAFTAPEHILSEALGNKRLILPPGVVCDPCNHGPLSGLDKALVEFPPLQLIRVLGACSGKRAATRERSSRTERSSATPATTSKSTATTTTSSSKPGRDS